MLARYLIIMLAMALVLGCQGPIPDDDAGDDDEADDDTGDDDMGDDDTEPPEPFWVSLHYRIRGYGEYGTASAELTLKYFGGDSNGLGEFICSDVYELTTTDMSCGASQGDEYWTYIDTVLDFPHEATLIEDGCGWNLMFPYPEPWEGALHNTNPLAFVSCESIADDPELAAMDIGPDPFDLVEGDPLTFGQMCNEVGPLLADQEGTGPLEGIWMIPMPFGWIDGFGNYSYFEPADTTNVETWGFFGYLMNDLGNEVGPGMDGFFHTLSFLVFSHG